MKPSGLMMLLGGAKGEEPEEEALEAEEPTGAAEDVMIDEFVAAVQDQDAEGARSAFKSAVRACMRSKASGEYEE